MRICITLDDVLRAKTYQFGRMYQKYIDQDIVLERLDMSSGDLQKIFGFKSKKEFEKFLYEDYAFNIFGEAPECDKMLSKELNLWQLKLEDDDDLKEPVEIILSNTREFNQSIGFTHFFLSKIATRVRRTFFPKDHMDIWKECDILITADQKLLQDKPEGKIAIKITTDYNGDCPCDYKYNSMKELLADSELVDKILRL